MNNLFRDYKHNKDFLDLIHYKLGYKLYDVLSKQNHPNIILSGVSKSGKTLLVKTVINNIFNNESVKKEKLFDNILFEYSNYHYYFDLKNINNNYKLIPYLKKIINGYNYYTKSYNYIILDNYENISETIQNKLKVLLEKSVNTCKIIIITNKYNKVIDPIKSRFFYIRIPKQNNIDKFLYFKKLFKRNSFTINDDILLKIIMKHVDVNFNFINILSYIKCGRIQGDVYDELINKYMLIINSDNSIHKKICNIKQILYLAKSVINVNVFLRRLLSHLLKQNYNDEQKMRIVKEFTEYDIMINKSFRDLLCLEGLLIGILTHSSS